MDFNGCDLNHLEADVRLPPRKRLLAGLKRESCSESTSECSPENNPSPSLSPSMGPCLLSEFDVRLNNLLKSYKNRCNMSPEEIASAAKSAADAAAKAAEAAKAASEEKAAIAAKAVAAAKSALNLVALEETSSRHQKKNKHKKCVPVQLLYNEYQPKLHRAINSTPRISKYSLESKNCKHKKLKIYSPNDKSGVSNGTGMIGGNAEEGMNCEGSNKEDSYTVKLDEKDNKVSKSSKEDEVEVDSGDVKSSP